MDHKKGYELADEEGEDVVISIGGPRTDSGTQHGELPVIARRQGSQAKLIINERGNVIVERRSSATDVIIAAKSRLSSSSLPNIFGAGPPFDPTKTVPNATETLEILGGKGASGAYSEHMFPLDILSNKFSSNLNLENINNSGGLTSEKAAKLLEEFGLNVLTPPPRVPLWLLFLLQFTNLLMILLMITGLACIIIFLIDNTQWNMLYLGVLLFIVVLVTCYETYSQEAKSDNLMEKFRAMVPASASVIRDGTMQPLEATQIVIGDLIRLKSGDKVPADCRVVFCQSMKIDQSMITGESEAVESVVNAADPNALEARNIIFNGSLVVDGSCLAVAIRTGDATLIGTMVELTGDVGKSGSTLKADITFFVKVLTIFALFQAVLIFVVGLSRGLDIKDVFLNGFVIIMIGNVPQGLPTTVTACLFIVADRMGAQNVFVKKLDIVETLGSCTCICTDKTGTLTQNLMSVANLWVFGKKFSDVHFSEAIMDEADGDRQVEKSVLIRTLVDVAILNSRVVLEKKTEDAALEPNGDATELGLYRYFGEQISALSGGKTIEEYRAANPKMHEIPFNSSNKWQMSIHRLASLGRDKEVLMLKGAPDVLLSKCSRYLMDDGTIGEVDAAFTLLYTQVYEEFGGQGERVLGFAMKPLDRTIEEEEAMNPDFKEVLKAGLVGKKVEPTKDLIFVGLITLMDPPRAEVPQAIRDCHSAGVKVVMVTGDHPLTAAAIARKIGLITLPTRDVLSKERNIPPAEVPEEDIHAVVIHGQDIPAMTEEDWKILVNKKEIVFARTSPEQKLKIVNEFTAAGNVTAMTGDGVNDSPALKQAAIGVAMGLNGSDVAREAADIVLLDDNFASIVVGIKEGRLLFANLKKSIAYTLAHLTPEVIPVLLWAFAGIPQPMGSLLALCIDLLTELVPSTSLAYEEPESLIMKVPPRNAKTDKLTTFPLLLYAYGIAGCIETGVCLYVYFQTFARYGVSAEDLFSNNNQYFPAAHNDGFVTTDGSGRAYSPYEQLYILWVVQGGWYLMIVCAQAVHLPLCRTSTVSIFEHGLFGNTMSNYGIMIAVLLGCFVTYTPGLNKLVQSRNPSSQDIAAGTNMAFFAMWISSEARKSFTRAYPDHWVNKKILAW